jgi:hypothetical protein
MRAVAVSGILPRARVPEIKYKDMKVEMEAGAAVIGYGV